METRHGAAEFSPGGETSVSLFFLGARASAQIRAGSNRTLVWGFFSYYLLSIQWVDGAMLV